MILRKLLKKDHTAATILQNFNNFRAKLEPWKTEEPDAFPKHHITIRLHPRHR